MAGRRIGAVVLTATEALAVAAGALAHEHRPPKGILRSPGRSPERLDANVDLDWARERRHLRAHNQRQL